MFDACFVIQRFDDGVYDKRFRETFAPAIEKGGATPIRADEVLGTRPVIEKIVSGLSDADIAFAEISEDNPNVFWELGFALALQVPTVIVCDRAKRPSLPFDISHRPVLFYKTESQSDFENIGKLISDNVRAAKEEAKQRRIAVADSATRDISSNDMDGVKQMCLLECLESDLRSTQGTYILGLQRKLVGSFISDRMVSLAVASLIDDGMLETFEAYDNDSHESYMAFKLTENGRRYVLRSYASLKRLEEERLANSFEDDKLDEDVPF